MKKIIAIILAVLMLTGCQLAGGGEQEKQSRDKMVGAFITFESLDLDFDLDALVEDHPNAFLGDGVALSDPKYIEYIEKLPVTVTEDGWEVPDYEGFFFCRLMGEGYLSNFTSEGIGDVNSRIYIDDDGEGVQMEGIMYFPEGDYVMLYNNPVYMNEAGEYYVVHGDGFGGDVRVGGTSMSISQELKWTENGEKNSYCAEFTATARGVTMVEKVKLIWRGENHVEISRMECAPGQMPDSIDAEGASLVVIEEIGGQVVNREVYEPGDETVSLFYQNEDEPWCRKHIMQINWPE